MPLNKSVCKAYNRCAPQYETFAVVQRVIGERLLERLDYLNVEPQRILDVGCGTGFFMAALKARYPNAMVVGFDLAFAMLKEARQALRTMDLVGGQLQALPFADGAFDLIFSNQVIHWAYPLDGIFAEMKRVLSPSGCLFFSTLGPDSLKEIRDIWAGIDTHLHVNDFVDMHEVGDALVRAKLADPVVDMEKITLHYRERAAMLYALKQQGSRNINARRSKSMTGKMKWRTFEAAIDHIITTQGVFPLTYEVVYGHAWQALVQTSSVSDSGDVYIPVSMLRGTL